MGIFSSEAQGGTDRLTNRQAAVLSPLLGVTWEHPSSADTRALCLVPFPRGVVPHLSFAEEAREERLVNQDNSLRATWQTRPASPVSPPCQSRQAYSGLTEPTGSPSRAKREPTLPYFLKALSRKRCSFSLFSK